MFSGHCWIVRDQLEAEGASRVSRRSNAGGRCRRCPGDGFPASAPRERHLDESGFCDLTHTFQEGFPVFATGEEPERETIANYATDGFYAQKWTFGEHSRPHMDVPGRFIPGGRLSPDITVTELIIPVVVVDIRKKARQGPERDGRGRRHQALRAQARQDPREALVAADSGWADKVDDPLAFRAARPSDYNFPGWGLEAALYVAERDVTAIGIDTLSLDPGNSATFPVRPVPGDRPLRDREPHRPRPSAAARLRTSG